MLRFFASIFALLLVIGAWAEGRALAKPASFRMYHATSKGKADPDPTLIPGLEWKEHARGNYFSAGYQEDTVWIKLVFPQPGDGETFYVTFDNAYIYDARFFRKSGVIDHSGFFVSPELRPLKYKFPIFEVKSLEKEDYELVFALRSNHQLTFSTSIQTQDEVFHDESVDTFLIGCYAGVVALLIALNLILYFIGNTPINLLYALSIFCMQAIVVPDQYGYLSYIFPIPRFTEYRLATGAICINLSYLAFLYSFLDLKKNWPWFGHICRALALATIVYTIPILFFGMETSATYLSYGDLFIGAAISMGLIVPIYGSIKRNERAFAYLISFLPEIATGVLFLLYLNGLELGSSSMKYLMFLGSGLHIIVMTSYMSYSMRRAHNRMRDRIITLNEQLEDIVEDKTRDIVSIMTHIPIGIFTISNDGFAIHRDHSQHLREILERDELEGLNALPLLFEDSNLSSDEISQATSAIACALDCDVAFFELNAHCLPTEVQRQRRSDGTERSIAISWNPIAGDDGLVRKVLVTARDITEMKRLQSESNDKKEELDVIAELLNISSEDFYRFLTHSREFIVQNRRIVKSLGQTAAVAEALKILFINMHTMKGAARALYLKRMTNVFHDVEQQYVGLTAEKLNAKSIEQMHRDLDRIEDLLRSYEQINILKLGRKMGEEGAFSFSEADLMGIFQTLKKQEGGLDSEGSELLYKRIFPKLFRPSRDLFEDLFRMTGPLAKDLKKAQPTLDISGADVHFHRAVADCLGKVFVHVIRNSLDHGLENVEERLLKGKSLRGRLSFRVSEDESGIRLEYADDGRGLDIGKITRMAVERGLLREGLTIDAQRAAELIFQSGFSTAQTVSDISGRGMGMIAVQNYLQQIDARISVILEDGWQKEGNSFRLLIELPKGSIAELSGERLARSA